MAYVVAGGLRVDAVLAVGARTGPIIGPLLDVPPAAGELHAELNARAAKAWRHPFTGLEIRFRCATLERWYYAAKKAGDPVRVLRNQVRHDVGRFPGLSAEAVLALTSHFRAHPGGPHNYTTTLCA